MNYKIPLFLGITSLLFFTSCKKDKPIIPSYYTFNINVSETIPIDHKIPMTIEEVLEDRTITHEGSIQRRGGYSIAYSKHSYEIDLETDISIGNLPSDDDWILNANYIDKTFMRHVYFYELFEAMNINNKVAKTKYAEVQLNGAYNGLYVLMEKLDKSSFELNTEDENAVIFKEPPLFVINPNDLPPQSDNFYQQTYPKKQEDDRTDYILGIKDFILNSSEEDFNENISNIFDIKNIIDWHLLLLVSNNNDGVVKNFYLYKIDSNTPLRIAPWDYDHSIGRDSDNELNLIRKLLEIERNNLLTRLLEMGWYKTALKNRWNELNNQELLTPSGLKMRIDELKEIPAMLVAKNAEKWPLNAWVYYDDNDFNEEIEIMKTYIDLRYPQLVEYFEML